MRHGLTARVAALFFAVLLAGCSGQSSGREASPTTTTSSPSFPVPGLEGRIIALGGDNPLDAGLYELTFGPPRLDPLTPVRRVTTLGACPTMLVVAAAQKEVGFSDHLQRFSQGNFGPIDGLGSPHAFLPVLGPDCRMLYIDTTRPDITGEDRLHVFDPAVRSDTIVHTYTELGDHDWGPGGRIAVVERSRTSPGATSVDKGIIVISPDGTRRTLPAPAIDLASLRWGASDWMVVGRRAGGITIFLQPDTGERRDLPGWEPRAWSPDGQRLLVADAKDQRRLGVVELADLATVRPLGSAPMPVHDTVWLPTGSDPVGSAG